MDYEEMLNAASNEIVYQTSGENDASNLWRYSRGPFPLVGHLDPDSVDDIVRVFRGRDDFRQLRALLREKAAEIYCHCAVSVCEQNGVGRQDADICKNALSAGNMDTALRAARDLVMFEMDGNLRAIFNDYHAEKMEANGRLEIDAEILAGNGDVTLSAGNHVSVLGKSRVNHSGDLKRLLEKSLPEIADMLPRGMERERKAVRPGM